MCTRERMKMSSILLSSLRANEILLANATSNVANMNTPEYKSIRTAITSSKTGVIEVNTTRSDDPAPLDQAGFSQSNVDLARELVDMIKAKSGFEATLKAISSREEMLDDLMYAFTKE